MPPKRRTTGTATAAKSNQSTLAFHGASNKVTKAGARTHNAKSLLNDTPQKATEPAVAEIATTKEVEVEPTTVEEPTTADAAIIDEAEKAIAPSSPEDDEARRITKAKIEKYWKAKEAERKAPRVHQGTLSTHEKILREFDMSSQYGPCTGIARLKRWKRAHRLGLAPPIEVLAVLLKEQESSDKLSSQRSQVDEILSSRNMVVEAEA
ncbi:hypothetical protein BU24DRAFT_419659 [Aaosphaeria arxii CBS 175.79]|uniref:DNA polymerase delta subunit 4 n=1 Tax=Aaosphaeria arxii CBS 175.79 TaxID=1450172 RepID=A0A6A5Y5L7_9PLEO|nr:uncharacterized protein BU24DRAFT_419659 [Aaosphaeria arxii CBS 175.79]KAF2020070.1 hypothetical protein BU24DRAFT_419659 [Aaosphaeria arxii CBS 175.79]